MGCAGGFVDALRTRNAFWFAKKQTDYIGDMRSLVRDRFTQYTVDAMMMQACDNECPKAFKRFLTEKHITLQLAPPYDHRTNPVEKAIGYIVWACL